MTPPGAPADWLLVLGFVLFLVHGFLNYRDLRSEQNQARFDLWLRRHRLRPLVLAVEWGLWLPVFLLYWALPGPHSVLLERAELGFLLFVPVFNVGWTLRAKFRARPLTAEQATAYLRACLEAVERTAPGLFELPLPPTGRSVAEPSAALRRVGPARDRHASLDLIRFAVQRRQGRMSVVFEYSGTTEERATLLREHLSRGASSAFRIREEEDEIVVADLDPEQGPRAVMHMLLAERDHHVFLGGRGGGRPRRRRRAVSLKPLPKAS